MIDRPYQRDWPDWGQNGITYIGYNASDKQDRAFVRHYSKRNLVPNANFPSSPARPDTIGAPTYAGYVYDPSEPFPDRDIPARKEIEGRLFSMSRLLRHVPSESREGG